MGKIINVDFKKKQKEFTWDNQDEHKKKVLAQLDSDFHNILDKIIYLTDDDREFQEYCARWLGGIMANIRGRRK